MPPRRPFYKSTSTLLVIIKGYVVQPHLSDVLSSLAPVSPSAPTPLSWPSSFSRNVPFPSPFPSGLLFLCLLNLCSLWPLPGPCSLSTPVPGCRRPPLPTLPLSPSQTSRHGFSPICWWNTSSRKTTDPVSPTAWAELSVTPCPLHVPPEAPSACTPYIHSHPRYLPQPFLWPLLPPRPWLAHAPHALQLLPAYQPSVITRFSGSSLPPPSPH